MTASDESGFSLPEVLVAISILTIVMGVVAAGFSVGARATDKADRRIAESSDVQLLATWFGGDVQSATQWSTTDNACTAGGDTLVLSLRWTDVATPQAVAYVTAAAEGGQQLVRRQCAGNPPAPARTTTVVRFLGAAAPSITCSPSCDGGSGPSPLDAGWIRLTLEDADGGTHQVQATRRATRRAQ